MMPQVIVRLPADQLAEIKRLAAADGVSVSTWLRGLIEEATGITTPVIKRGFGGMSAEERERIQTLGVRAFKKASKARAKAHSQAK